MKFYKNKVKKIAITLSLSLLIGTMIPVTSFAKLSDTVAETIVPKKDDIRWVYKRVGNTLYRRLFNFTTNVWIGDWEPAYPEK